MNTYTKKKKKEYLFYVEEGERAKCGINDFSEIETPGTMKNLNITGDKT